MRKPAPPRPTEAELAILQVLWDKGPSTVRTVHETLSQARAMGYTTALKTMQIMAKKGLVRRDEREKTHVYRADRAREKTQGQLVSDLLERAFGGSAEKLVMRALDESKVSAGELDRIRQLLDGMKGEGS